MTLDESIQGMRLQVIRRATQIGVSAACAEGALERHPELADVRRQRLHRGRIFPQRCWSCRDEVGIRSRVAAGEEDHLMTSADERPGVVVRFPRQHRAEQELDADM
jgi:hypothetical protein